MAKSKELLVDQVIGSAYQVVKYVAFNMDTLLELSGSIPTLTAYMPDIQAVLAAMPVITNVNNNMAAINNVSANLGALLNINTNMAALLNLNSNLTAILAVPAAIAAQDWKNSVRVATTSNIALSGVQTVDGIPLVTGNRVLVKNQTTASQNGIYLANTGAWTRATDGVAPNVSTNNTVMVDQGTTNSGKQFRLSTTGAIIVGTTAQIWEEVISGEINTISNQGTGIGIGMSKTGSDLPLKSLKAGSNVILTDNGNEIEISSTGGGSGGSGEANTTSNTGTGEGKLAKPKSGVDLPIKSVKAGTNITISNDADDITISSTGEANTALSVGSGESLVKDKLGVTLPFKSLKAGSNIVLTSSEDEVVISTSGGSSVMVPIAMATVCVSLSGSLDSSDDGDTWREIARLNISAAGDPVYDPDGIVDPVNMLFIVPDGATHFTVDYVFNISFNTSTHVLFNLYFSQKALPYGPGPSSLKIDHLDVINSDYNPWEYKTIAAGSHKATCTPGHCIKVGAYWEGAAGSFDDILGFSDSTISITFYSAP